MCNYKSFIRKNKRIIWIRIKRLLLSKYNYSWSKLECQTPFNERITARQNSLNKNSSYLFKAKKSLKNNDILICLDLVAREYGGEVINKN